jgi:hypothetical protein
LSAAAAASLSISSHNHHPHPPIASQKLFFLFSFPELNMSSSSTLGYFSVAATAAAAAAAGSGAPVPSLSTLAPLPTRSSTVSSAAAAVAVAAVAADDNGDNLEELAEIVNSAAATASASASASGSNPTTMTTKATVSPAGAAVPKLPAALPLPIEERWRMVETDVGGIWIHGEPSSTIEPGFRALICVDAKPVVLPAYLGLPTPTATGSQDSLRHSVFLQRTANPNEMFGRWVEAEATDDAAAAAAEADDAAAAATDRRSRSRLTLRIGLDEYLTLLGVVRDEWKQLETGLTSAARQLSDLDQPVSIDPLMQYLGFGTCIDGIRMGPRLVMRSFLESRFAASAGIRIQLELLPSSPGQVVQRMEVPFPSLVAMATKSRSSLGDLYERWYNSLLPQQRQQQER